MRYFFLTTMLSTICCSASVTAQVMPPSPAMTNGGAAVNNGMKHVNVALSDTAVSIHIDSPPVGPVTMMSGHGIDYTPAKFDPLEGMYFNAQHGWLPDGFFDSLPNDASIWIERTGATQPLGSTFKVYEAGNMSEGMASWTMDEIYTSDGFRWQWDGLMQHDFFTADLPGDYSMTFQAFVGDAAGNPLTQFAAASATLEFVAVPEPTSSAVVVACFASLMAVRRRR